MLASIAGVTRSSLTRLGTGHIDLYYQHRVDPKTAADGIELSAEQVERLNHLTPAAGERHDQGNMAVIDR
jgi:aryl-alcohol dehydrogenase-like predicted oxidoreductase